jgi:hypothetical protein
MGPEAFSADGMPTVEALEEASGVEFSVTLVAGSRGDRLRGDGSYAWRGGVFCPDDAMDRGRHT